MQLWVLGSDIDFRGHAACKARHSLFNRNESPSWTSSSGSTVELEYGSGALSVWPGTDTVTFAGAAVTMNLGVASSSTSQPWLCFEQDGILGLAYPSLAQVSSTPWFFAWADATASKRVMSFYLSPHGQGGSSISLGAVDDSHGLGEWYWLPLLEYTSAGRTTHAFFGAQIYFAERSSFVGISEAGDKTLIAAAQYVATESAKSPVVPGVVDTGTSLLLMPQSNFIDFAEAVFAAASADEHPCAQAGNSGEIVCPEAALHVLPNITLTFKAAAQGGGHGSLLDVVLSAALYTCCDEPCASAGFCAVRVSGLPSTLASDEWLLGDTFQIAFATAYDMDENRVGIRAMTAGSIRPSTHELPPDKSPVRGYWLIIGAIAGGLALVLFVAYGVRRCRRQQHAGENGSRTAGGNNTINPLTHQAVHGPTVAELGPV